MIVSVQKGCHSAFATAPASFENTVMLADGFKLNFMQIDSCISHIPSLWVRRDTADPYEARRFALINHPTGATKPWYDEEK